jgi:hypothetical protein
MNHSIAIDLSACGMRALFYWGVYSELIRQPGLVVDRIYGRSSGAIVGAYIFSGLPMDELDAVYERVQHYNQTLYIVDSWCRVLYETLPDNAYELCSNRLFVSSAFLGCLPYTTSVFRDNVHLVETLRASGSIPFVTTRPRLTLPFFDGGFVDWWYALCNDRRRHVCTGPVQCAQRQQHVLHVRAPRSSWPDYIPLSAHYPLSVVHASIAEGVEAVVRTSSPDLYWTH